MLDHATDLIGIPDALEALSGSHVVAFPAKTLLIGGDPDGHQYFMSQETGEMYVWWHDPGKVEKLNLPPFSFQALVQWRLDELPEHPKHKKWTTFVPGSSIFDVASLFRGHPLEYSFDRLRERLAVFGSFEEQFVSDDMLELLQPARGLWIRLGHRMRGRSCKFDLSCPRSWRSDEGFVAKARELDAWLTQEGFCDVDDASVRVTDPFIIESDER